MIKKLAYIFIFLAYSLALFSETDFNIDDSIITKILNGKVYTLDNLAKNSITIIFDDNKISGKSTINTYSASYHIIGDNIEINNISASKMNGPQNLMKEEEEYLQLLSEAHNLEIKGNVLKIKTKADKELIFKEVVELSSNYLKGKEFVLKNAFDELNITIGFTKNYIYGYNNRDKYPFLDKLYRDSIYPAVMDCNYHELKYIYYALKKTPIAEDIYALLKESKLEIMRTLSVEIQQNMEIEQDAFISEIIPIMKIGIDSIIHSDIETIIEEYQQTSTVFPQ